MLLPATKTDSGYTGHEHLDEVGPTHMSGRLLDPTISRFMQGDPFIADPNQLEDYDRFAYCMNNLVTCTDPSGYLHMFGHNILPGIFQSRNVMAVLSITASIALMEPEVWTWEFGAKASVWALAGQIAIAGFASGAIATGNLKCAVDGGLTAAAFLERGQLLAAKIVPRLASIVGRYMRTIAILRSQLSSE